MQKGSLIFIKTDVKELFEHMDQTISINSGFEKLNAKEFNSIECFNPKRIKTNREKYATINKFTTYQSIYIKN